MAVYYIRDGGTKVSGASTPDDWSVSNCYPWAKWAAALRSASDGDSVVFYDEADGSTKVTHDLPVNQNTFSAANAGAITIESRSGDPSQCEIRADSGATLPIIKHNNSTNACTYTYKNLTISGPVGGITVGGAVPAFVWQSSAINGDLIFDNCIIGNVLLDCSTELIYGLISSTNQVRTLQFHNVTFENITSTKNHAGGKWIGHTSGSSVTVLVSGDSFTIQDIAVHAARAETNGFYSQGQTLLRAPVTIQRTHCTAATEQVSGAAILCTGHLEAVYGTTIRDCTNTGGSAGVVGYKIGSPAGTITTWEIDGVLVENVTIAQSFGKNSTGAGVFCFGVDSSGSIKNVIAKNVTCNAGAAVYYSQGAEGTAESIYAENCNAYENGGAVYHGGGGNMSVVGLVAKNCRAGKGGGCVFTHVHPTDAVKNKIFTLRQFTLIGCEGDIQELRDVVGHTPMTEGPGHGIFINNDNTTYTGAFHIENGIIRNGFGVDEITLGQSSTGTTSTVNIINCDIEGGESGVNNAMTTDTPTLTNITDDGFINDDGKLIVGTALVQAGAAVFGAAADGLGNPWNIFRVRDSRGRRFRVPFAVGGYQPSSGDPITQSRLAR